MVAEADAHLGVEIRLVGRASVGEDVDDAAKCVISTPDLLLGELLAGDRAAEPCFELLALPLDVADPLDERLDLVGQVGALWYLARGRSQLTSRVGEACASVPELCITLSACGNPPVGS